MDLWKALAAEFIGTFTLVLIIAGVVAVAAQQGQGPVPAALASGLILIAIVYTWGQYSHAHVNPATSFGVAVAGEMPWTTMIAYWIVQFLGAILAAALITYFFGTANGGGASVGSLTYTDQWKALLVEAFITFFLVMAFLFASKSPAHSIVLGLAYGSTLAAIFFFGGSLTGASANPARSLGPALFTNNMSSIWIYLLGPAIGALVAGLVFRLMGVDWGWGCEAKKGEVKEVRTTTTTTRETRVGSGRMSRSPYGARVSA